MGTVFQNTAISKFNELYFFENTALPSRCFYQVPSFVEVSLPKKLTATTSGTASFNGCTNLKVYCPEGFKTIPYASFNNCSNTTVVLPTTLTTIGDRALYSGSYTLVIKALTPPSLGNPNGSMITRAYVPDESVAAYKAATNWSAIASKIYPISQYEGSIVSPVW